MHRSRAPSIAPGTFFVAQSWADCITNIAGFNLRQAQPTCDIRSQVAQKKGAPEGGLRQPSKLASTCGDTRPIVFAQSTDRTMRIGMLMNFEAEYKSEVKLTCAFSSRDYRFQYARGRIDGHNFGEAKAGFAEKTPVLGLCSFLPPQLYKHYDIEHFSWMRRVAGWQHHFDEKQMTNRVHSLAHKAKDRKALIFVPVMDDVRKNISVCPGGNRPTPDIAVHRTNRFQSDDGRPANCPARLDVVTRLAWRFSLRPAAI
jgi:hypothetical protein